MTLTKVQSYIDQVKIVKILLLSIILMIFTYVYLINSIVFNVASHQKMASQISIIQSEVSDLELSFIEKNKDIKKEMAVNYGLTNNIEKDTIFVLRGEGTRLTFNEQQ